jgi:uncharacterized protein (DUF983 family)
MPKATTASYHRASGPRYTDAMSDSLVSPFSAGFRCVCPRCGEGDLFAGFLKVAPVCQSCGLDLKFADSGDGPAIFVIFAVAPIVIILAFIVESLFHPAPWMHLVLWIPAVIILSLLFLRPFKGVMIALQYQRQAGSA